MSRPIADDVSSRLFFLCGAHKTFNENQKSTPLDGAAADVGFIYFWLADVGFIQSPTENVTIVCI